MNTSSDINKKIKNNDWKNLTILIFGLGISGISVMNLLNKLGAKIVIIEESYKVNLINKFKKIGVELLFLNKHNHQSIIKFNKLLNSIDLTIISPGINIKNVFLKKILDINIPIWSDIQLGWYLKNEKTKWILVTGTNGKTTVVNMLKFILSKSQFTFQIVGNIGRPLLDIYLKNKIVDILIVEISSFQLYWTHHLEPWSSILLNLKNDHIDWHGSYLEYFNSKFKVYSNTQHSCFYSAKEFNAKTIFKNIKSIKKCKLIEFSNYFDSSTKKLQIFIKEIKYIKNKKYFKNYSIKFKFFNEFIKKYDFFDNSIENSYIPENVGASILLAKSCGVELKDISKGLLDYNPIKHRICIIRNFNNVKFINDSKATNAHSTLAAMHLFNSIIWICGGVIKSKLEYDNLMKFLSRKNKLKSVIFIGKNNSFLKKNIINYIKNINITDLSKIYLINSGNHIMKLAVQIAWKNSHKGDTVLLSPAAASYDYFQSYEQRGDIYEKEIRNLLSKIVL